MSKQKKDRWQPKPIDRIISANIKKYRLQKGWSQSQLADEVGVSQPLIGNIEALHKGVGKNLLPKIAKALGIRDIDIYSGNLKEKQHKIFERIQRMTPLETVRLEELINLVFPLAEEE